MRPNNGDLASGGRPLGEGQIDDSNHYSSFGMPSRLGVEIRDLRVLPADETALAAALSQATRDCDLIITTGGVPVGEARFIKDLLQRLGAIQLWQIVMKPAR